MTDRLAFRTLVGVASLLFFCLGCLLILPLEIMWLTTSLWVMCCALLISQAALPMPAESWPLLITATLALLLFSLMLGRGLGTAWKLWRATQRLIQATQTAPLPPPPVVARLATRLNLAGSLVVVAGRVPFSFCYGFWRPRICLSLGLVELLTEAELEAVLRHEAYHLHRREPLRMAIAICLSHFFFFVPLLAELRDHYLAEKELSADAAAVAGTGRASLARALRKLVTVDKQFMLPSLVGVAGLSVAARRVDRLINPTARSSWTPSRNSILVTLAVFVSGCLLMIAGLV